jgi:hypothetical protein
MRDSLLLGLALSDVHSEFALDTPDDVDAICFSHLYPQDALSCDFLEVKQKLWSPRDPEQTQRTFTLPGGEMPKAPRSVTCASLLFRQN